MRVQIVGDDRAMLLKALELADKECDRVRDALERLQLDDMTVQALQGVLGELRVALKDAHRTDYEWNFVERRAAGIAMLFYKATINKRRDGDEKLLIDPRDIVRKLGEVTSLLEELSGQETLFTRSTTWSDPKPAKDEKGDDGQLEIENASLEKLDAALDKIVDGMQKAGIPVDDRRGSKRRLQHRAAKKKTGRSRDD